MSDVYFFKSKKEDIEDFYLRVDHKGNISFITIADHHIFTALDLASVLQTGIVTSGINIKTINITTFVNMVWNKRSLMVDSAVIVDSHFRYTTNGSFIYVNDKHDYGFKDNKLKVEYQYLDSDRHKEKTDIEFIIDTDKGIISKNYEHFFYAKYSLFRNFEITKL